MIYVPDLLMLVSIKLVSHARIFLRKDLREKIYKEAYVKKLRKIPYPVGTRPKMNVFSTFKIGPFVPIKKERLLDVF